MSNDTLGDYLYAIGRVTLLTAEEEISYAHRVQEMLRIREETKEEDWTPKQRRLVRSGDRAKRRMVEANLRLVVSLAKKYINLTNHLEINDLISEGNIGLIRAVEKYDPTRGYKFSTYAYWWIRQGITRAMSQQDRTIKLPCNAVAVLIAARKFTYDYETEHGTLPQLSQIAEHCDVPKDAMELYLRYASRPRSLDEKAVNHNDGTTTLIELIADPMSDHERQVSLDATEAKFIIDYVNHLGDQAATVIKKRYGIDGHEPSTLKAIGDEMGIGRERVRQIENRTLNRLRVQMMRHNPLKKICA